MWGQKTYVREAMSQKILVHAIVGGYSWSKFTESICYIKWNNRTWTMVNSQCQGWYMTAQNPWIMCIILAQFGQYFPRISVSLKLSYGPSTTVTISTWVTANIQLINLRSVCTTLSEAKGLDIQQILRWVGCCLGVKIVLFVILSKFVLELLPLPSKTNKYKLQGTHRAPITAWQQPWPLPSNEGCRPSFRGVIVSRWNRGCGANVG